MARRRSFTQMIETFGFDTDRPWAADAFRLLFHTPRAYEPLVDAWDARYPGTKRALRRLVDAGFVARQDPLVVDTRTGERAERTSRRVERWRITSRGKRRLEAWNEDLRVVEDEFPNVSGRHVHHVVALLDAFDLEESAARNGISANSAIAASGFEKRLGRWWLGRFGAAGYVRRIERFDGAPLMLADVREIVPAHWRPTRLLGRQLTDLTTHLSDLPESIVPEFRLGRTRFLDDIDPARIGPTGATDFDHDIEAQRILAALLRSERLAADGVFHIEPRISLPAHNHGNPLVFDDDGTWEVFYQPDGEFRERTPNGVRRAILEYERFQSRRDAWAHIERLCGYMHTLAHPFEAAVMYFVVDSAHRQRSYVELIEAFCDHALDHPETMPANEITLCVSSSDRVISAADPLDAGTWARIRLPQCPQGRTPRPVLHDVRDSPYEDYFGRGVELGG